MSDRYTWFELPACTNITMGNGAVLRDAPLVEDTREATSVALRVYPLMEFALSLNPKLIA